MITQAQFEHRREFWAHLVRQVEWSVKRAKACRDWDPVARRTLAEAEAELAKITVAAAPVLGEAQPGGPE